jgi:hypothetical protein
MTLTADINQTRKKLIAKAKRRGLYENFGQDEVRALKEKHIDLSDYSKEMNAKRDQLQAFDNWCMNYEG